MAGPPSRTSTLVSPLASVTQLESSGSQLDGVPADLENSIRFEGCRLTQAAGVLLQLPQDVIAQAIVLFARFWTGPEGGSLKDHGAKEISVATMYLITKLSSYPKSPRSIINTYAYLAARKSTFSQPPTGDQPQDPRAFYVSESSYHAQRSEMMKNEAVILRTLGFQTFVALPYTLCINYLQIMDVFDLDSGKTLVRRAFAHMNSTLLSPQLIYLTHQPNAIATAAIYLAAKEVSVKLPEEEWWQVFDTDREELGFLVVAMTSMESFAEGEKAKWAQRNVPMTIQEVNAELAQQDTLSHDGD